MIPSRKLIVIVVLLAIPMMLGGLQRDLADIAMIVNVLVVIVAGIDLMISPSPRQLQVERSVSDVLSVGAANPCAMTVQNCSGYPVTVTLHDDSGELCVTERLPQTVLIRPWESVVVHYAVQPLRRGASTFEAIHLRFPTRLTLWTRHEARTLKTPVRIYPDIRAVYRYELMARQNRLAEIGVRMVRMPGQGREFERLREYRYGDEIRHIDWKATSRQRELISREFNVERNQSIVIMVDSGRFMRNESNGISYLDLALNSAIMLSYIALGQGDNVSLVVFSNRIERFIRPVRGKPGIQTILRSTYDIQASEHTADYSLALEYLTRVQRKRALVILITFVTDELQLRTIGENLRLRSMPYLPVCALLQDVGLRQMADRIPNSDVDAFHTVAAADLLTGQAHEAANLRQEGVLIVDTPPELLTERLINEYLNVKMRNLM
ncbi:MAG: DUF58 domain-containing protein [Planctomycetaceae bacterium]|nr:DUF58 domain-containing protein [Planctomycetaceae bacterium]MCA9066389.1 DUF58 domain-containing protein [Planctomycetaceae bacterium]